MPFNLIMHRPAFTAVNEICCEHDKKFKHTYAGKSKTIPTAKIVNALIDRQLVTIGKLPADYMIKTYGCEDPINEGFTPRARNEKSGLERLKVESQIEKMARHFSLILEQWADHPDPEWRRKTVERAEKWQDRVRSAEMVVALANGAGK